MCSVMPTACAIDWNQCSNSSVSISPRRGWLKLAFHTSQGRPEMSSATRASASSIGE